MWVWGDFLLPSLIVTRDRLLTLPVGIATFQRGGGTALELSDARFCFNCFTRCYSISLLQRYFIQGLTDGAVKEKRKEQIDAILSGTATENSN